MSEEMFDPRSEEFDEDLFALEVATEIMDEIHRELESFGESTSLLLFDASSSYDPDVNCCNELDEDDNHGTFVNEEPFLNVINIFCRVEHMNDNSVLVTGNDYYHPIHMDFSHRYLCSTYRHALSFMGEAYLLVE